MSMRENPSSGYVIELSKLQEATLKLLPDGQKDKFLSDLQKAAASNDWEEITGTMAQYMKLAGLPEPESAFILGQDDESDGELEKGIWYLTFAQADLYKMQPKPGLLKLQELDAEPSIHSWAQFG